MARLPFVVVASTVLWVWSSFLADCLAHRSLDVVSLVLRPINLRRVAVLV